MENFEYFKIVEEDKLIKVFRNLNPGEKYVLEVEEDTEAE